MAELVKIEETIALAQPRAAVWPLLARTDWINRALKLPAVRYEVTPLPEGGSRVIGRTNFLGLSFAWREFPFEWTEPEFHQVRREFFSGPFGSGLFGLRLQETGGGCEVNLFAHITPRNSLGKLIAKNVVGPKMVRDMKELVRQIGGNFGAKQIVQIPNLPVATANPAAMEAGMKQLRAEKFPEQLIARLGELLGSSPDVELSHIRPFTIARQWQADRWDVLKLFLHATRAGLLNLRWEVLCPNCRAARLPRNPSLANLAGTAHCDVCNIKFDAEFDRSVELKFSVNPSVRPCDEQTFCLAGPGARPHLAAQIWLEPGEKREWRLPQNFSTLRLRSAQVKTTAALPEKSSEITCMPEKFAFTASGGCLVSNPNAFPIQVALESGHGDEDILTAAQATNWQEFRDLFATEVISPTERVTVGSQVVLFTDLRGSTAMYSRIGDAPAYALVRDHFKILHDVVSASHGGVVKTIGDAVMAVFSDLGEALAAARQMHKELDRAGTKIQLQLKCALHVGPCLAVNANDRLDYFGSVVNLAARLVEKSRGGDLVVADEIYQRTEMQHFLQKIPVAAVADEERLNGFAEPFRIWRVPML